MLGLDSLGVVVTTALAVAAGVALYRFIRRPASGGSTGQTTSLCETTHTVGSSGQSTSMTATEDIDVNRLVEFQAGRSGKGSQLEAPTLPATRTTNPYASDTESPVVGRPDSHMPTSDPPPRELNRDLSNAHDQTHDISSDEDSAVDDSSLSIIIDDITSTLSSVANNDALIPAVIDEQLREVVALEQTASNTDVSATSYDSPATSDDDLCALASVGLLTPSSDPVAIDFPVDRRSEESKSSSDAPPTIQPPPASSEAQDDELDIACEDPIDVNANDSDLLHDLDTVRRYRPAARTPRELRPASQRRPKDSDPRERALSIALRLSFRPGGICQFSLLAQRRSDFPYRINVRMLGRTEVFSTLQDDWYELRAPAELGELLRSGAIGVAVLPGNNILKWTLAQRDVYVLGVVPDFGGYVTVSRLVIGEEHVILCDSALRGSVADALAAAGCAAFSEVNSTDGIPDGWIAFRNVNPTKPVPALNDGGILDTLRPLADLEIALRHGIKVDRSDWLLGHGPTIILHGDVAAAGVVLIDGQPAAINDAGVCDAPGKGDIGEHTVWSASKFRSYRIVEGLQEWEAWPAHRPSNSVVCGAAVFPMSGSKGHERGLIVPSRDAVLIGARVGEIHHCLPDPRSRSSSNVVFPAFDPIWLIPRFPLRCDRAIPVIHTSTTLSTPNAQTPDGSVRRSLREWCRLILDAHHRRLVVEPSNATTEALWNAYEQVAHAHWRRLK